MTKPVYIFDVDGVINALDSYYPDPRVLGEICSLLATGHIVALNTGRGYESVRQSIIPALLKELPPSKLDNLFVVVEMGGVVVTYSKGQETHVRTKHGLTPEQINAVKQIYDRHGASLESMQWYEGKTSMATVYKEREVALATFATEAKVVADALHELFKDESVKIVFNPDAIDVMSLQAGKWAGAALIHEWLLKGPAATSVHFICFGDNGSDYEMARYFAHQGHKTEFIFTGQHLGKIDHHAGVVLTIASAPYAEGTYQFLLQRRSINERG